jgi:thymidylate synthase ThyX
LNALFLCYVIFLKDTVNMSKQITGNNKHFYNQQIRFLFTQLICETESLYKKVTKQIEQNSQTTTTYISN